MPTTNLCPMVSSSASERCHATLPKLRWSWRVGGSTPMTINAGVGMSRQHNPNLAGREAAEQALEKAGVAKPDFIFVFASIGYDQQSVLRAVREATGGAPLTGCSVEGTIDGDEADESNFSVLVTAISSDELRWHNGLATGLSADSCALGKRVAKDLLPNLSTDTIGLFAFPDGLTYDIDNFFAGLEGDLPSERFLPIWGGGAGNNLNLGKPTYQYCDDEVVSDAISYALLSGEARPAWAIGHSLIPIGGERIVTRSQDNVIYEIDGKPATEVLKEYLPEDALTEDRDWLRYAISLALSFRAPSYMKDEEYVVRGVPQLSLTDGSITLQTEVQEGTSIWFSSRDKEKISTGFDRIATQIREQLDGAQPELVFQFECVTRGKLMFCEQEKLQLLKRFRRSVGPDVPWVGFYTIREIGPVEEHNGINRFASVILALS